MVVIAPTMFNADILHCSDGDTVHIPLVPDRFEEGIRKTKGQYILHCFFSQIMIDAVNLAFIKISSEDGIQYTRRLKVIADRFLDDDPCPFVVARQSGLAQILWNFAEHA